MTNDELLEALAQKHRLQARQRSLTTTLRRNERQLAEVNRQLKGIQAIGIVLRGVAVAVDNSRDGTCCEYWTLATGSGIAERRALLYKVAYQDGWAVRINERSADQERFSGGRVLGLGHHLGRDQVQDLAERWLVGEDVSTLFPPTV